MGCKRLFTIFLYLGLAALASSTVFSLFHTERWYFELFVNFKFQYALGSFVLTLFFVALKKYKVALICLLVCLLNIASILPNQLVASRTSGLQETADLDILSINLLSSNQNFMAIQELTDQVDPDLLLLIEYTSQWDQNLQLDHYPHRIISIREDHFGIALFSKIPFEKSEIVDFTHTRFPLAYVSILVNQSPIHILGVHFENPMGLGAHFIRNLQMRKSDQFLNALNGSKIIIGDFNCTPYSRSFQLMQQNTGLLDSRSKWSIGASWPHFFYPLKIPIDHALVSPTLHIKERQLKKASGSDHNALYISVILNE